MPASSPPPPPSSLSRRLGSLGRWLALLRVPPRLAGMVGVTVVTVLVTVVGRWLLPRRQHRRWGDRGLLWWSRGLGWVLGMRVRRHGEPPERPFLLVSNHLSYVDVLLLGAATGGAFVAKREIASWPVMGALCRLVGTVFVDRRTRRDLVRAAAEVERALGEGRGVVLFPEATTGDGDGLLPFRSSMLEVAAAEERPVHHAVIRYETPGGCPPARRSVCWTGGQALIPHALRLLALPGFRAHLAFGERPLAGSDRKQLARRLRSRMEAQLAGLEAAGGGGDRRRPG